MSPDLLDQDQEVAGIFPHDPAMHDLARLVRAARPSAPVRLEFAGQLRTRLMEAAPLALRPRGLRRLRPGWMLAASGATLGAAMASLTVVTLLHHGGDQVVHNIHPVASITAGAANISPDQAITVAFDQPMDHHSVEQAIHITPATAFTTSWRGNTLTIAPTHLLASQTAYVVSVDSRTARGSNGATLAAPVVIPFGTKPAPTPSPTATSLPALSATTIGQALPGSALAAAPDGGVFAGSGLATPLAPTAGPSPSASASPVVTPSSTPAHSPTAAPAATPGAANASPAPAPQLLHLGGASPGVIGPAAGAVALSPAGRSIAYLSVNASGGAADVVVANLDGSHPRVLTSSADGASPLAWTQTGILFISDGSVRWVDLGGVVHSTSLPSVQPGGAPLLVRDGHRVVVLSEPARPAPAPPSTPGSSATPAAAGPALLVDLADGSSLSLPGPVTSVAVSADGSTLAWAGHSAAGGVVVERAAVPAALTGATLQPSTVDVGGDVRTVNALALNSDGSLLGAALVLADGTQQLRVVNASGHIVGVGAPVDAPVFVGATTLAGLATQGATTNVELVRVSGTTPAPDPNAIPVAAGSLLDKLVAAQAPRQAATLAGLPTTGTTAPDVAALTPEGVTQAYAVTVVNSDTAGDVSAHVRLIHIPGPGDTTATVTAADEAVALEPAADGSYAIATLTVTPLVAQASGPHVLHASATGPRGARVLVLSFDSDLDPTTVDRAVSVSGLPSGERVIVRYEVTTRTVVVTLPADLDGPARVTVTVSPALHDIDGNALSQPYSTALNA